VAVAGDEGFTCGDDVARGGFEEDESGYGDDEEGPEEGVAVGAAGGAVCDEVVRAEGGDEEYDSGAELAEIAERAVRGEARERSSNGR
jgi:hypothetical protein